ncbi:MAG: AAA family ATPase [Chloroflexi bacterium]|nr:AAA family ATPase [Chloroflexota bacterium]
MKCPNCSIENTHDAKFCENCGQPFDRACPQCGKANSPAAKFCKNCGYHLAAAPVGAGKLSDLQQAAPQPLQAKIISAKKHVEGERRLVTVLFTDIVGSTALAEKLDPEEWGEIVSGAHQRVSEAIYRYEGTIAQLLGDGVLAFFGAPIAHEDDPVRAVNAALDIQAAINEYRNELKQKQRVDDFKMRVGLNTGLVVVGNIGSDMHVEYLAVGDTVNLAARMQSAADAGTILISKNTQRLARHIFDLESRGELEVKGKAERVPAYRVLARKAIPESARGIEGLSSPLVGREKELATLQTRIEELKHGRGQIIAVMGEAGLGKSRLVAEMRKWAGIEVRSEKLEVGSAETRPTPNLQPPISNLQWLEGRSLSYQTTTPFAPFVDLFTRHFELLDISETDAYARVKTRIADTAVERASEIAPFLAALLGIQIPGDDAERVRYLEPPQLRGKIFQAAVQYFELLAARQPLVLMLDDLHWADSASLDLLEAMLAVTERAPILLLAVFRPHRQEPAWRFHETATRDFAQHYTPIQLEPLDEKNSRQLVANLLEIEDLPEKVRALILRKAEGNPFFVEEVIRSLLDAQLVIRVDQHWRATREIENIAVPDTLAGVITARLDRLDDVSKRIAQTAAVIGREFQFQVLSEIADARQGLDNSLLDLQKRELVHEKARLPELLYLFKHALTQETAYQSILLSRRRELHKRVAECLERNEKERVNDIARHFLEAQEYARALPYLVEAGERAARAYSNPEAIGYFTRALEILKEYEHVPLARRVYEGLGGTLMLTMNVPRALEHFNAMIEYGKAHAQMGMQVSAHNKLGMIFGQFMGQLEPAETHLRAAEQLGRDCQDGAGLSELFTIRCGISTMQADFSQATHYLGESVNFGRQSKMEEPVAFGLAHTANTYTYMCRFDDAYEKATEALEIAERIGNQRFIAEMYTFVLPYYYAHLGDLPRARDDAEKGILIAQRIGDAMDQAIGLFLQGMIASWRGEYENALALHQQALAASMTSAFPVHSLPLAELGAIYQTLSAGFANKVAEFHQQALAMLENPIIAASGAPARAAIGFCLLADGKIEDAAAQFEKGLNYPSFLGLLAKPRLLAGSALVALAHKQLDDAAKLIGDARTFAEDHAMKFDYPFVSLADAQIRAARGDVTGALSEYARAESLALEMQMRPTIWQARAGAASVLEKSGKAKEAEAQRIAARAMAEEIAELFENEEMRKAFGESATRKLTKGGVEL